MLCLLHHVLLLHGGGEKGEDEGQKDHLQGSGATQYGGTDEEKGEAYCENLEENVQLNMACEELIIE